MEVTKNASLPPKRNGFKKSSCQPRNRPHGGSNRTASPGNQPFPTALAEDQAAGGEGPSEPDPDMNRLALTTNRFQRPLIQPRQQLRILHLESPNAGAKAMTNRAHRIRLADKLDERPAREARLIEAMNRAAQRRGARRYIRTTLAMLAGGGVFTGLAFIAAHIL